MKYTLFVFFVREVRSLFHEGFKDQGLYKGLSLTRKQQLFMAGGGERNKAEK